MLPLPLSRLLGLGLMVALAPTALAQQERWYQVELLVFSHQGSEAARAEQWPATPPLAYPNASRFLVEPALVAANLAAHEDGESEMDEFGRQFISFPLPAEDEEASASSAELASEAPLQTAQQPPPETPTPFVVLHRSAREFDGKAAYMQRTGKYRTLFHQAWLQPVGDERNALPLVLDRSGDSQDWPLLQGSVKLYLSRYLHIETNFWLNTDGSYLPGEWRMPAPPLGPASLFVAERPLTEEELAAAELQALAEAQETQTEEVGEEVEDTPQYAYRHAVLMQQKRRMRSNEVHYIDHPLLGVVVRLTPVDEEYLRALAAAEFSGAALPAADQAP